MGQFAITLSDVGEGVAEAELIEWHVAIGDVVTEDQLLAVVMTDKAAVEIPSSVLGRVVSLNAQVGDVVAVGSELLKLEIEGTGNTKVESDFITTTPPVSEEKESVPTQTANTQTANTQTAGKKPLAAPSVRLRAKEANIDLYQVTGSGPAGRIIHDDIDHYSGSTIDSSAVQRRQPNTEITKIKVVGLRRKIAEKMSLSKSRIPHITIVEEVDVSNLEDLRAELNDTHAETRAKLTLLPFVMKTIVEAVKDHPDINAHFDDDSSTIIQYGGIHIGIATQTPNGLIVPVVRHCEVNSLWDNASEIARLSDAARQGSAKREELSGSTITITSLGPLGAIATTPIINHPEVAIIGINKMSIRPHWDGQQFVPRKKINISCSFDHRVIDGWVAATLVQKLTTLLENPAMLFVEN